MHAYVLSHFRYVRLFVTLWTVAHQVPLFMRFSRQEYQSGSLCSPLADLSDPRIEPRSPASQADSLPTEPLGKPMRGKTQRQQQTDTREHNLFILQKIKVHSSGADYYTFFFSSQGMRDFIKFCVYLFLSCSLVASEPLFYGHFCDAGAETW